jgi:glycine cleavage system H lipoate-binding protein/ABC-type phosphate transport system substrate-binding protein
VEFLITKMTNYNKKTMKRIFIFLITCLLVNYSISSNPSFTEETLYVTDSISIFSSPDLYNLSLKWAGEYSKSFPEAKINVVSIKNEKMAENLLEKGEIGFVSNEYYSGFDNESLWKAVIGRDVIVPVINSKNPYLSEIFQKGISPERFTRFFGNKDSMKWGTLLNSKQNSAANFYFIDDEFLLKGISEFLKTERTKVEGIKSESAEEMISLIKKDPNAIGFCRITDILDPENQTLDENLKLMPIDRNGNGTLDYNEKIYDNLNSFNRGVWIGKYPKTLFNTVYSVSLKLPENDSEVAFLKWVITDGQKYLFSNGYTDLLVSERQSTADKLYNAKIYTGASSDDRLLLKTLLFVITTIILTGLITGAISRYRRRKKADVRVKASVSMPLPDENSLLIPAGIYFDKTHTWAFMEQNGVVKVGIDDFLQHLTGPLTRIKMKNEGYKTKKGEHILSIIQNGKQLNIYSPISGTIVEKNSTLITNASMLNSSPYNDGWIYRIEPTNWMRENQLLFMADKHRQYIKNEISRLKDFLAGLFKVDNEIYARVILQDGGEIIDNTLANMGPEVWEDFQSKFLDPSRQVWFYELF